MGARHFGARVTRLEDPELLAGHGRFVDDMHLPGALHAASCAARMRMPRIRAIDAAAALALPGVHAVLTADDLPEPMRTERMPKLMPNPAIKIMRTQHALAREEVCYVGEPIAIVIADTRYIAEDAAAPSRSTTRFCPPPPIAAMLSSPDAPLAHPDIEQRRRVRPHGYGDVRGVRAARRTCSRKRSGITAAAAFAGDARRPGELRSRERRLTVWSSTQTPHLAKRSLAEMLDRDPEASA